MGKITFTDKEALNIESDVPAKNKIQATDVNQIKNVVNQNDDEFNNLQTKVVNAVSYSTNEKIVGTDENGKNIYRKLFVISVSNSADIRYTHNLTNLNRFWINNGESYFFGNSESLSLNYYYSSTDWARTWINDTTIRIKVASSSFGNRTAYVFAEYTKTTD